MKARSHHRAFYWVFEIFGDVKVIEFFLGFWGVMFEMMFKDLT